MPFVNVKITKDGVTREQKAQIIQEITDTLVRVLNKKPEHTHIVIEEVELDNWGFMGQLTSEFRKK
jgi:4-oxalocrotonate tautomerase